MMMAGLSGCLLSCSAIDRSAPSRVVEHVRRREGRYDRKDSSCLERTCRVMTSRIHGGVDWPSENFLVERIGISHASSISPQVTVLFSLLQVVLTTTSFSSSCYHHLVFCLYLNFLLTSSPDTTSEGVMGQPPNHGFLPSNQQ